MDKLTLIKPDDWHLHVRDGSVLHSVVPHTARAFARAIIMPNLTPPVTTTSAALAYRERILAAIPQGVSFEPLMTLYLTDNTSPEDIRAAADSRFVHGAKLYPAGATTNSDAGVSDIGNAWPALEAMEALGLPLLVHGEAVSPDIDVFDREAAFIDQTLIPLRKRFPALKIVFEHITTRQAAEFVTAADANVAATLTPQHLLYNRNALFRGGLRPHHYCLPVLKRESHREALLAAATSGNPKFFLGTDSAPHSRNAKEDACGCAGIYSAHAGIELYAEAFDAAGALAALEGFASLHGPRFYGLQPNTERITLIRQEWTVPAEYPLGTTDTIVPLKAGDKLGWKLE